YPFGSTWSFDREANWGRDVFFRGFFMTLYCGALGAVGLAMRWRPPVRAARTMRALALLCTFVALSGALVPAGWAKRSSPVPLRFPEKFEVGLVLALAV